MSGGLEPPPGVFPKEGNMEIIAKQNTTDTEMVELYTGSFLMGVVHIDVFGGEPYQTALYDGVPVELEMGEVEA